MSDFRITDGVLTLSGSPQYLKSQLFAGNKDVVKAVIPASVGFFEEEVFAECENLREVVFEGGTIINIGIAAFTSCTSLEKINIPDTVKEIEEGAFLECTALREIVLPEGLLRIADLAFQNSALEEVSIPASCQTIGEEAFFECETLRRADVLGEQTRICLNAFGSCYNLTEGFIAPGYPEEESRSAELLYSLLWASCPEKHKAATRVRAERFIRENEALVMERIFKYNNIPAMNGIASGRLLSPENIDSYVREALDRELTEITALLLSARGSGRNIGEDFEL